MKNRVAGFIIVGIALLIGFIVFSFNMALTDIVNASCSHGPSCPMWGTINFQTYVGMGIMVFVIGVGVYFIFAGENEKIITTIIRERIKEKEKPVVKDYTEIKKTLDEDQNKILDVIIANQGTSFQSQIVEKTEMTKVKISRELDRLEGMGIIERRRHGMSNVIVLKK